MRVTMSVKGHPGQIQLDGSRSGHLTGSSLAFGPDVGVAGGSQSHARTSGPSFGSVRCRQVIQRLLIHHLHTHLCVSEHLCEGCDVGGSANFLHIAVVLQYLYGLMMLSYIINNLQLRRS